MEYTTRKLLMERLGRDGYLFIRGAIDRETVLRARSYRDPNNGLYAVPRSSDTRTETSPESV